VTLTIGAYSILQPSINAIIPLFQKQWKQQTGQTVDFKRSFQASGSQATAIIQGFAADIALLSLEGDMEKIAASGLITNHWQDSPHNGMITDSITVIGVREGNPKHIDDWSDLTKHGVTILLPNPSTSGGAKWDINAIYGAGLKASSSAGNQSSNHAKQLLSQIYKNVEVLDNSGANSLATFDKGVGDAVITYENELITRIRQGRKYEEIIPNDTILIENPAALVDRNVDKHGNRAVAEAFLNFLWSPVAQQVFADTGNFRPVDTHLSQLYAAKYKKPPGLFEISYLGGWPHINHVLYDKGAMWETVLAGK